jgi:hydrogenase nickel incorporation protein HypA/HybF
MHELSIAMSIVEMAEEESQRRGGAHIVAVHLRLGLLAGVVREALLSSYEMASADTPLAGSQLIIDEVPGVIFCRTCNVPRTVSAPDWFLCSECGAPALEIMQGKELEVVSLEIEE